MVSARFMRYMLVSAAAVSFHAVGASAALVQGLGTADGYSTFVFGNVSRTNGSVTGKIAAGGDATYSSYSIASDYNKNTNATTVVVGRNFSVTGGSIQGAVIVGNDAIFNNPTITGNVDVGGNVTHQNYGSFNKDVTVGGNWTSNTGLTVNGGMKVGGNLVTTGSTTIKGGTDVRGNATINTPTLSKGLRTNGSVTLNGGGGSVNGGLTYGTTYSGFNYISGTKTANTAATVSPAASPIDFSAARTEMRAASASWSGLAATGSSNLQWSTMTLTGNSSSLNVFTLSASDFTGVSTFNINVPAGSTVLINIAGDNVSLPNIGWNLNGKSLTSNSSGADYGTLLWNFYQATKVSYSSLGGAVFAPWADVTSSNGQLNGVVVAENYYGSGGEQYRAFVGSLPSSSSGGGHVIPEPTALSALLMTGLILRRHRA